MIDCILQFDFPRAPAAPVAAGGAPPLVLGAENSLLAPPLERLLRGDDFTAAATMFNPLLLVGPSGSGKSHVAQGLVRAWSERVDSSAVAYFTAADFGREAQAAHADKRLLAWRKTLGAVRLLVIEDVDRLRPRTAVQRELRVTIDALLAAGAMIVVTSLREPPACRQLDAGLRDRLVAGLTVRLRKPELPARRAILAQTAAARGLALDPAQLDRLAKQDCATPAQLLGRLAKLNGSSGSLPNNNGSSGPLPLAGRAREGGDPGTRDAQQTAALKQILALVARYFGLTQAALTGPSRRKSLVGARNIIVHLARRHTQASYTDIGRLLGDRDHTTVMHADRRMADWLAADPAMQQAVDQLDRLVAS